MTDISQLGKRLRELRTEKGLGLREVAAKAEVNHGYLSQLERGEVAEPAPAILQKLAKGYGVPFPVLMDWAGYLESGLSANHERALSYLGDQVSDQELELVRAFLEALRSTNRGTFPSTGSTASCRVTTSRGSAPMCSRSSSAPMPSTSFPLRSIKSWRWRDWSRPAR